MSDSNVTNLTLDGVLENIARQRGDRETATSQFSRKGTGLVTLTVGECDLIVALLSREPIRNVDQMQFYLKERGYNYGYDAAENVYFGWQLSGKNTQPTNGIPT